MGLVKRSLLAAAGLLIATLAYMVGNLSRFTGIYQQHEALLVDACRERFALPGAEDVVSIPGQGVFVSAVDRAGRQPGFEAGIYWIADDAQPVLASKDAPRPFGPHGIDLLPTENGYLLYAISHQAELYQEGAGSETHSVEVFEVTPDFGLKHLRTLNHPLMRSPNDLSVLSEDRFYFSNDWRFLGGFMRQAEQYLALPVSDLVFYDQGDARIVDKGLNYPNGVALSADKKTLWLNEVRGRSTRSYEVDLKSGELTRAEVFSVATVPDNVTLADDGTLIIAGIPKAFAFQAHAEGHAETAPAQIFRLDPATGETENLFYTEDGTINGATVGRQHGDTLFIGTAYGATLLKCPMP